jgi:uncharacterized protein YidB (DUF937 family)
MGLLEDLAGKFTGGAGSDQSSSLVTEGLKLLQNYPGGLSGLVQNFQNKGLGDIVSSWVGTGANASISPDQMKDALGSDQVNTFAEKTGISQDAATGQLANLLPGLVDKLTPDGKVPEGGLLSMGKSLLEGFLGKSATPSE